MPPHTLDTHVTWTDATPANRAMLHFAPQQQAERTLDVGTDDDAAAPSPHDLLDAALASCTALTLRLYAARRGIALRGVDVSVSHETVNGVYRMARVLDIDADLTDAERATLLRVADACPVHKTLSGEIEISTLAKPRGEAA
jgi:putative redox protein